MRLRLALVVLLLVVFPTAVLSVLASRALRSSELLLRRELALAAGTEIRLIEEKARAQVLGALERLKKALGEDVLRGGSQQIELAVGAVRQAGWPAGGVYVFVSPWGFLYPDAEDEALLTELRRLTASARTREDALVFAAGERQFCFIPLAARPPMFAGFEAGRDFLGATLAAALRSAERDRFVLVARGADGRIAAAGGGPEGGVVVSDTFGGESAAAPPGPASAGGADEPLATIVLGSPFQAFTVTATVRDAERVRRTGRLRSQMFAWGILILAGGVCLGGGVLLREAAAEIRRARSRSEFVIGVSHDLRTPVSSMRMLAETMYLGRVTDAGKQREFLGLIVSECERLSHLIERVLFFVRFGQHALSFAMEETDPAGLVREAVRVFMARYEGAPGGGAPLVEVETRGLLPPVTADGSAMTQVLLNLLDNAEKYSGRPRTADHRPQTADHGPGGGEEEGAVRIEVAVEAVRGRAHLPWLSREWVRITVRDHGIGMGKAALRRIFREFYRGPEALERNISGVGLGLALCRHVVRAHGGRIAVQSSPGEGSAFSVFLPAAREGG